MENHINHSSDSGAGTQTPWGPSFRSFHHVHVLQPARQLRLWLRVGEIQAE